VICDPAVEALAAGFGTAAAVVLAMSRDAPLQGSDLTVEARSGLMDLVGDPGRSPLRLGGHQTAYAGGLAAYLALAAALVRRRAGAAPTPQRVYLLDVAVWLNWKTLGMAARTGAPPSRAGERAEWTVVPCADGHAALVYRPADWPRLLQALDEPRLAEPRFATPADRQRHRAALNAIMARAFARMTRARVHEVARRLKLPLGPVWTPEELLDDPQMLARGFFRAAGSGAGLVPGLPAVWNGCRPSGDAATPAEAARIGERR
jgi:crotonobetainyl-CoA:carnitine CoA-transferase CaiB-like acyl-CoA transferase